MRRLTYAVLTAALVSTACSDEQTVQPTSPTSVSSPASVTASPVDSARIVELIEGSQALIQGLFGSYPNCTGNCNAAMTKFDQIAKLYTAPPPYDMGAVVSNTYDLVNWILQKWDAGVLNDPPGGPGVTELINRLFVYAGISATVCDIGTDCDFTFYQPGSPATTLTAPSGFAQLQAPQGTGTVTQPTLLSVYRLTPDNDLSMLYLETQLDQYPLQYDFSTSSGEEFLQSVTLTVCLADNVFPPDVSRLRLAHSVAQPAPFENIQILPSVGSGNLSCNGATQTLGAANQPSLLRDFAMTGWRALTTALTPEPLHAAFLAGTGVTGTSKNLSPFGIVDYLGLFDPNSATSITALQGTAVAAPSVRVFTPSDSAANYPAGSGMAGIPVTFTITAGGGCFDSPCGPSSPTTLVVNSDASGYAAVPAWTIGLGTNTATASASIPCSAPVATGTVADCGTILSLNTRSSSLVFTATGLPPVSNIAPATLATGVQGGAYPSTAFTASGGNGSFTWSVTGGALPAGLTLSGSGALTGTPTVNGAFNFDVTATSGPVTATQSYSLTILPPVTGIGPASLADGVEGAAYASTSFSASGGTGSYAWAITGGALPAGLALSTSGTLTGTPTANGTFNFDVTATSGPATGSKSYTLIILPPAVITGPASPLGTGVQNTPYPSTTFTATGGNGSYSWAVTGGALPAGLTLSGASLSGTPTASGSFSFDVTVTSGVATATQSYAVTILPPVSNILPVSLATGVQGGAYPSTSFTASGGTGSYTWAVTSGALPAGLTLSGNSLSGTPTVNGTFNFGVTATSGPATGSRSYSLTILPPVAITPATLPNATVGVPYSQTLSATGGTGSYSWTGSGLPSWATATLPALAGTPTAAGTSNFTVTASSVGGPGNATKAYSITAAFPTSVVLAFQPGPSGTQCYAVNTIMTPNIAVKVATTSGAPLNGVTVNLVAVLNNGSTVVVSQPSAVTGSNGLAVFNTLSINKAGGYQLRASTASPWPAQSLLSGKFKISPSC